MNFGDINKLDFPPFITILPFLNCDSTHIVESRRGEEKLKIPRKYKSKSAGTLISQ